MRWSASLSLFLLLRVQEATAALRSDIRDLPKVYLYDPQSPSLQADAELDYVDAHVASLIFAHRLDIAHYLSIGEVADLDLQHLNKYTTPIEAPLGNESPAKQLFVVVNNAKSESGLSSVAFCGATFADNRQDETNVPGLASFRLSASPRTEDGMELFSKFASYVEETHGAARQGGAGQHAPAVGRIEENEKAMSHYAAGTMSHEVTETLSGQWRNLGTDQRSIDVIYKDGGAVDSILKAAIEDGVALTLVVNPRPTWGSDVGYNIYGGFPSATGKVLDRRQEAPLLEPTSPIDDATPATSSRPQSFATNATKFPLTAQCYDSAQSCESETNSCSGHGECILTRKGPASSEDEDAAECYQCKCGKDEVKNADGSIKTTYYGGSACQKKDISAPFWILTLTAGSLIALVGFGVGMLYAMGNAELPSVIGAGVSGPKAK